MGEMFALLMLLVIQCIPKILADNSSASQQVRVAVFCDSGVHNECVQTLSLLSSKMFSVGNCSYFMNGSLINEERIFIKDIEKFEHQLTNMRTQIVLAIGHADYVRVISIVCQALGIPLFGYITSAGKNTVMYRQSYISLNSSPEAEGAALAHIIGKFNMPHTAVLIQDSELNTGFLQGFATIGNNNDMGHFKTIILHESLKENDVKYILAELATSGWKILVLHCHPDVMLSIVKVALNMRLFGTGYAWFLTETALSTSHSVVRILPQGLLAVQSFPLSGVTGTFNKTFYSIANACLYVLRTIEPSSFESLPRVRHSSSNDCLNIPHDVYFQQHFIEAMRSNSPCGNMDTASTPLCDDAFHLLNLVIHKQEGTIWDRVGYITADGESNLKTVLWPGRSIYGPSSNMEKTYRVVTRAAKPFVFIDGPVDHPSQCFANLPCLQVFDTSPQSTAFVIETFLTSHGYNQTGYRVHCCRGLTLDLLDRLASDLNFTFVVYFVNDTNYGTYRNGEWTGMVGDITHGAADIVAGAFSMTTERLNSISFTEPFFQNTFAIVTGADGRSISMWAFLSPFSLQVWICILISSVVAGIATSVLEWYSPFGLNPRGRRRDRQYSLGSGLVMVLVLLTGHTVSVKAPKSWPGKVIQNVWAGLAIFIMTSYTANLAAYLAGQSAVVMLKSIYDSKLLFKKVSLIKSSAVESFLSKINPDLSHHVRSHYTQSAEEAILKLRAREIDVYLDDSPLLEYAVSRLDQSCSVRFVGKGFGTDGYAFGLQRYSWLQVPFSNRILQYSESGVLYDLTRMYLTRPKCDGILASSAVQYGMEHTGGLFIILSTSVILSILLVCGEHAAYRYFVPWIRQKKSTSWWKSENLAFLSQRLYRVVRSERLYSQKETAQEMMKIVKERDFTRLIQKHELLKRKIPKKKEKTKAEMFQELTADIVSYQRQLKSAMSEEQLNETANDHLSSQVTIMVNDHPVEIHTTSDSTVDGLQNHAYHPDDYSRRRDNSTRSLDEVVEDEVFEEETDDDDRHPFPVRLTKFYSTWPTLQQKSQDTVSQDSAVNSASSINSSPKSTKNDIYVISDGGIQDNERTRSPVKIRIDNNQTVDHDTDTHIKGSVSPNNQPLDYFQRNLHLKDNRVKSTLRRHALSGYQSHVPVEYLDECTIEALSKEDLLVLWKKSEIELQTRLNAILARNQKMSLAIDYLLKLQTSQVGEEV